MKSFSLTWTSERTSATVTRFKLKRVQILMFLTRKDQTVESCTRLMNVMP